MIAIDTELLKKISLFQPGEIPFADPSESVYFTESRVGDGVYKKPFREVLPDKFFALMPDETG